MFKTLSAGLFMMIFTIAIMMAIGFLVSTVISLLSGNHTIALSEGEQVIVVLLIGIIMFK